MAILKAEGVEKVYSTQAEQVYALRKVNFEIKTGDFLMINGPSGSGKTTLLNLLSGIDQPTAGNIYLNQQPLRGLSDSERTVIRRDKIGLIFQSFELIPVLTVSENVEYPLLLQKIGHQQRQKRVKEVLEQVGLRELSKRLPSQLSGGQKQRVAIARALVTRPTIILADEPTGNLDSETGLKIIRLMLDLNRKYQVAVVIVTHDLTLNQYAQQIYQLRDGVLTQKGEIRDVEDRLA
ncbi:MAG TPA: lipoprotein-releasing system ATP-binding protein LolD [Firmicutes bacterium]|nr:lipoprotein-releasing system ATP-binding protein LolD [Bacillota bacterium]